MNQKHDELKAIQLTELKRQIALGIEQAKAGKFVDGPEAFARLGLRKTVK